MTIGRRHFIPVVLLVAGFMVGVVVYFLSTMTPLLSSASSDASQPLVDDYVPSLQYNDGSAVIATVISSSWCVGSHFVGFPESIGKMKFLLRDQAIAKEHAFYVIGVSLDWPIDDGLTYLSTLGSFDEIAVGRNWLNTTYVHFAREHSGGHASVPQVVVSLQLIDGGIVVFEAPILNVVGADKIVRWVEQGAHVSLPEADLMLHQIRPALLDSNTPPGEPDSKSAH